MSSFKHTNEYYSYFRPLIIHNIEYWRITNEGYDKDSWLWRKIHDKNQGLNFVGVNDKETKNRIKELLFKIKLRCFDATYIQKSYITDNEIERCIWFTNVDDFRTAVDLLESERMNG